MTEPVILVSIPRGIMSAKNKSKGRNARKQRQQAQRTTVGQVATVPAAASATLAPKSPKVSSTQRGILVTHTEAVDRISGTVEFFARRYAINPANASVFPWLSQKANQYEKYRFRKLVFTYSTRTATDRAGQVTMAYDYDIYDSTPGSTEDMLTYAGAIEGAPWSLDLSVHADRKVMDVARYNGDTGPDRRLNDMGFIAVATSDFATTELAGRLLVSYVVELSIEQTGVPPQPVDGSYGLTVWAGDDVNATRVPLSLGDMSPPDLSNANAWNGMGMTLYATLPELTERQLEIQRELKELPKLKLQSKGERDLWTEFHSLHRPKVPPAGTPQDQLGAPVLVGEYFTLPVGKYHYYIELGPGYTTFGGASPVTSQFSLYRRETFSQVAATVVHYELATTLQDADGANDYVVHRLGGVFEVTSVSNIFHFYFNANATFHMPLIAAEQGAFKLLRA